MTEERKLVIDEEQKQEIIDSLMYVAELLALCDLYIKVTGRIDGDLAMHSLSELHKLTGVLEMLKTWSPGDMKPE